MRARRGVRRDGFTLLELLLVVAILAIVGGVLAGQLSSGSSEAKRELAASQVASALRFARSEAARTGEPHGARLSTADHRIRVYRLDTSGAPPVEDYSVIHPVDKRPYDQPLGSEPLTSGVEISVSDFRFGGDPTPRQSVSFQPDGTPVSPLDLALMDQGTVHVRYAGLERVVDVAPVTGRVSVQ